MKREAHRQSEPMPEQPHHGGYAEKTGDSEFGPEYIASAIRCAEAELYFYAKVFGFQTADEIEPVEIANLSTP